MFRPSVYDVAQGNCALQPGMADIADRHSLGQFAPQHIGLKGSGFRLAVLPATGIARL